ncbi:hypothetical protein ACWF99_32410 [Nocardia sp. NPDC055002]
MRAAVSPYLRQICFRISDDGESTPAEMRILMWKTVVAGGLVGAALIGGGGVAAASGSAVSDARDVADTAASSGSGDLGSVVGIPLFLLHNFIENQFLCPLASASGEPPCEYRGIG